MARAWLAKYAREGTLDAEDLVKLRHAIGETDYAIQRLENPVPSLQRSCKGCGIPVLGSRDRYCEYCQEWQPEPGA